MSACAATPIYSGPKRPNSEVAIIETEKVVVHAVDGHDLPSQTSKFSLLPGVYEMAVVLDDQTGWFVGPRRGLFGPRRYTTRVTRFCMSVKPGRTYLLRPLYSEDLWRPELIDENTTLRAGIRILPTALDVCKPPASPPPLPRLPLPRPRPRKMQSLGLVSLVVRDYEEALAFYVGKLGFRLVEDSFVPEQNKRWVVIEPPGPSGRGARLLLARGVGPEQTSLPPSKG